MRYWLVKSEPACFSIKDLEQSPDATTMWDGVRNYQARNFMRDSMKKGDLVFFYHSVTDIGIVGLCEVVSDTAYPDPTQWDPENEHFDPKSPAEKPRWYVVDIRLKKVFPRRLSLQELRDVPGLEGMELLRKGSRLSVQPVSEEEFAIIMDLIV